MGHCSTSQSLVGARGEIRTPTTFWPPASKASASSYYTTLAFGTSGGIRTHMGKLHLILSQAPATNSGTEAHVWSGLQELNLLKLVPKTSGRPLSQIPILNLLGKLLEPEVGVEPTTYRLQGDCSSPLSYTGVIKNLLGGPLFIL